MSRVGLVYWASSVYQVVFQTGITQGEPARSYLCANRDEPVFGVK